MAGVEKAVHWFREHCGMDGKAAEPGPVAVHALLPSEPDVTWWVDAQLIEQPDWPVFLPEHDETVRPVGAEGVEQLAAVQVAELVHE